MAKKQSESTDDLDVSINILNSLMKGGEEDHFNYVENKEISVSTGSLILDQFVKITSGITRLTGYSNSGKSSEAATIIGNLLSTYVNQSKAIWIKAEGRLSENLIRSCPFKFVHKPEDWVMGTCFVLESNVFEFICSTLTGLCKTAYDQDFRLGIVIDSVDALKLKADEEKELGSEKVSGPQALMKRFLRRMSLPIAKYGILCLAISQVSSDIRLDPYSKEPPRMSNGSGGNAIAHWANNVLEFQHINNGDYILENPSLSHDVFKNKYLGHWVTISIKKSDTDNKNVKVKYPVKHGPTGGIWKAFEICELLIGWGLINKKGAWLNFSEDLINKATAAGLELKGQHQGINNLRNYLEENRSILDFLTGEIKPLLS